MEKKKIGPHYEFDDGVKVGDSYYIYEEGIVYTYKGDLAQSSARWKASGTFPSKECDDLGIFYEDGIFHIFGEHGHFPYDADYTDLTPFTSRTGLGGR